METALASGDFSPVVNDRRWQAIAQSLLKKWRQPAWVDQEDLVQDLIFAAWQKMKAGTFDANRGKSLDEYILWNAIDKAKKRAHRQRLGRRPHRGEDSMASKFEVLFVEDGSAAERLLDQNIDQELRLLRAQEFRHVCGPHARTQKELLIVEAITASAGDLRIAAYMLYTDPDTRRICRLGHEQRAVQLVAAGVRTLYVRWREQVKRERVKRKKEARTCPE